MRVRLLPGAPLLSMKRSLVTERRKAVALGILIILTALVVVYLMFGNGTTTRITRETGPVLQNP